MNCYEQNMTTAKFKALGRVKRRWCRVARTFGWFDDYSLNRRITLNCFPNLYIERSDEIICNKGKINYPDYQ